MFCNKCGHNNEPNVKFCVKCGNKLELSPSESSVSLASDTIGKCNKCGHINDRGVKFCVRCGNKVNQSDFESPPKRFAETTNANINADTYSEFGTGAKIWFGICGIGNILANISSIITLIIAMINYNSFSFLNTLTIVGSLLSISVGVAYFMLLAERKKNTFYFIAMMAVVLLVFNIIVAMIGNLGFETLLISAIAPIVNLGITYAVLSKYGGNKLPEVSSISGTINRGDMDENINVVNSSSGVCCPKCGGRNLQVVSESNTTGGGYGAGKGCCGYILLGPLGILCGACGSKAKTTTKTFFVCMDCGNKFAK